MKASTTQSSVSEMFGQAARMFESSLESMAAAQEESANWFMSLMDGWASPQKFRQRNQAVMQEMATATRKNVEEAIRLMHENARAGLDFLQKASEQAASQVNSPGAGGESQETWETALAAFRENLQAGLQANRRLVESWARLAKIMSGQTEAAAE